VNQSVAGVSAVVYERFASEEPVSGESAAFHVLPSSLIATLSGARSPHLLSRRFVTPFAQPVTRFARLATNRFRQFITHV